MISILIGLMILAGLVTLFANNSRERDEIQRANQQTENGQYALQIIGGDLHEAGYLGSFDPAGLSTPTIDPDPCATDVASLNAALPIAVQGFDNVSSANPPLSCISDVKDGTDILVIRRAGTCPVNQGDPSCPPQVTGGAYFQASGCNSASELGSGSINTYYVLDTDSTQFTLHQHDCSTAAPLYAYEVHVYFVSNDDKPNDHIPTLKRVDLDLANGGFTSPITVAEGIDDVQVDYGIDNTATPTGSPAVYTANPYSFCAGSQCTPCAGATCLPYWRNIVSAEVYVLARNTTPTPGYTDTKTYTLGTDAAGNPQTYVPVHLNYKRHVYRATFRLINISGRNVP